MNNYFNLKTIINRNVLYLQQRVDNVIIVNTPPQLFVDNQSVTQQAYFIKTMKKVALLIAATFLLLTLAILPVKVKGQIYKKVTTAPADWNGTYLIVYENGASSKVLAGNANSYHAAGVDATVDNSTIEGDYTSYEVVIINGRHVTRVSGNTTYYLQTNTKNNQYFCQFGSSSTSDNQKAWTFESNGKLRVGYKYIKWQGGYFKCMVSSTYGSAPYAYLYRRQPEEKEILGAGTVDNNRYYLIASPVTTLTPSTTNGFIREDGDVDYYDLYSFDQSNDDEWRNYKVSAFNLVSGKGYLYANKDNVTLKFDGAFHNHQNMSVNLAYTEGQKLAGWNLIGNPYDVTAYLTDGRDFLRMNDDGDEFIVASDTIGVMEGVFVQTDKTGQSVTFTVTDPNSSKDAVNPRVVMNIIGNNDNVIDRAIVRFGEGKTLSKLTLIEDNTKIYIPKEDGDYAVVRSNGQKNIPVNFKASKLGQYTISVETEGLNLSYLHLIDKLTDDDIDLLKENKYSFIASPSDSEPRFILAFNANGDYEECETFAYQNGSDVVIRGDGELQVFDVMGRLVAQKRVNGEEIVHVQSQGVYIFRLNGKTQKIVVR